MTKTWISACRGLSNTPQYSLIPHEKLPVPKPLRSLIITLIMLNILIILAGAFMMPLWATFVAKIGGDIRTAGNAICIFSIVIGGFTCITGKLESAVKRNTLFVIMAQALMLLGYVGYFFVHHPWQLYVVQIILGVGGAFQSPALYALYHECIDATQSTFYWGMWNGAYNIAIGIGALLSAYIIHNTNFTVLFSVMTGIAIIGLVFSVIIHHMHARAIPDLPHSA